MQFCVTILIFPLHQSSSIQLILKKTYIRMKQSADMVTLSASNSHGPQTLQPISHDGYMEVNEQFVIKISYWLASHLGIRSAE